MLQWEPLCSFLSKGRSRERKGTDDRSKFFEMAGGSFAFSPAIW